MNNSPTTPAMPIDPSAAVKQRLARLSPGQLAAMQVRLEQRQRSPSAAIRAVPGRAVAPLSFAQERLWFLDQWEPNQVAYNSPVALWLGGNLRVQFVQESISLLVQRHSALRTCFRSVGGRPVQVVVPEARPRFEIIEVEHGPLDDSLERLEDLARDEARQRFDLRHAPLLRCKLFRFDAQSHLLLLTFHHIILDGWSVRILLREFSSCYSALCAGRAPEFPELPIQYTDFSVWQRDTLSGAPLDELLRYWRAQMTAPLARLELPLDRPRPPVQTFEGAVESRTLRRELSQRLARFNQQQNVTLFMTLLAAFQVLCHRYTGQADVVIGMGHANRNRQELQNLVGCCVNILPIRTDLSGTQSFRDVLRRVREVCLAAYAHQDLPFEALVAELRPTRDVSSSPLFNVAFTLHGWPQPRFDLPEVNVRWFRIDTRTAKFDLTLFAEVTAEGLCVRAEYNTDLFAGDTIRRLLEHYEVLLKDATRDVDLPISRLALLTVDERRRLTADCRQRRADYSVERLLPELIQAQARRAPDSLAVCCEGRQLSYRELLKRAERLSRYLRARQVRAEVPVGLCLDRSVDSIVGLLAIWLAGGAYVPIDHVWPEQRVRWIVEDAQLRHIVTRHQFADVLCAGGAELVHVDGVQGQLESTSVDGTESAPMGPTQPGDLAYIIYTSGSSGRPKGVAVEHRQLVNYVLGVTERLEFQRDWTYATVSTIAADLGNTMIFPALCAGGCLHVVSKERALDPNGLAEYFIRNAIDCLKIAPSHLAALLDGPAARQVLPRKRLVLGGEPLHRDLVGRINHLQPTCRIFNHYGPTEATIGATTFEIGEALPNTHSASVPIGRPLPHAAIYILDEHMQPVPVGVAGELCIGGAGVARGYWNQPQLTAERFDPDPFAEPDPVARLYHTGDRARLLADGNIEFLGRLDRQTKVRGYRVEPGEVESVIRGHPQVVDAAVIAQPDPSGDHQLAAYVVPRGFHAEFAGKRMHKLPHGLPVAHLDRAETDYMYREIFQLQAYLRHGITLEDGDCVFDVGANIGLFSVFVNQVCPGARIYACEPNPTAFEILQANARVHCRDATTLNVGLGSETTSAEMSVFEGYSLLSGYHADAHQEKSLVKAFMANQSRRGIEGVKQLLSQADGLLDHRFALRSVATQVRRLSEIIQQQRVDRIDLLKINVEKSELHVLQGIDDGDWGKLRQVVLEVDLASHLPAITEILERQGFEFAVQRDDLLEQTPLCYVYAIRPRDGRRLLRDLPRDAHLRELPSAGDSPPTPRELHEYVSRQLPSYMVPASVVVVGDLPLTSNGKLDRRALESDSSQRGASDYSFVAPRTSTEKQLARIWRDLLHLTRVGIHDNFLELGGHSLLAMRVVARIKSALRVDLPLRDLFESPKLADVARNIDLLRGLQRAGKAERIRRVDREAYRRPREPGK